MIRIRKTLYLTSKNTSLFCDHDAFVVRVYDVDGKESSMQRIPPTLIEQIVIFGEFTITSPVIKFCQFNKIAIYFTSFYGNYYGKFEGTTRGNVTLRKKQYGLYSKENKRLQIVKNIILGKGLNQIAVIQQFMTHCKEMYRQDYENSLNIIQEQLNNLYYVTTVDECRGYEGVMASAYFHIYDKIIQPDEYIMRFDKRSKRPPENRCNALLSFLYTMLHFNCVSALETFGLDSYFGYLHEMKPGRESMACDLMEELRAPFVDRFVAILINRKQVTSKDFEIVEEKILLTDSGRKKILDLWEKEKEKEIYHPCLKMNVPIKVIPYLQAQLMAQTIRGDIEEYPPFVLK